MSIASIWHETANTSYLWCAYNLNYTYRRHWIQQRQSTRAFVGYMQRRTDRQVRWLERWPLPHWRQPQRKAWLSRQQQSQPGSAATPRWLAAESGHEVQGLLGCRLSWQTAGGQASAAVRRQALQQIGQRLRREVPLQAKQQTRAPLTH